MPNKTIYVSDSDLPLFERAQQLTGGNLSGAITAAVRRLVDLEEAKLEGFDEITVRVGAGKGRRQRFMGVLLVDWNRQTKDRSERYRVYRSRTGKYVVHTQRSPEYVHTAGPRGDLEGWRKHFSSEQQWGQIPKTATLEIVEDLDSLRGAVPRELYDLVVAAADEPTIEDLDI